MKTYVDWLAKKTGKEYRLLSEAEWEYAARGGTSGAYPWGDEIGNNNANCYACGSQWDYKSTAPVGSFSPNGFGLYDMVGNARQWTLDCWHDSYKEAPSNGSAWTSGDCGRRLVRGSAWNHNPWDLRVAFRLGSPLGDRYSTFGFRLARTLN